MSAASSETSSGDASEQCAPETPAYEDEGVSAMQRAFFQIQPLAKEASLPAPAALEGGMHRCASAPAIRESISSWHLSMVIASIKADSNGSGAAAAALNPQHRRSSAVDESVLSQ